MGILVNTGFKVGSAEPLDENSVRETVADRDDLATNGYVYEGMEVYCKDTKVKYRWNGTDWEEVGIGGGSGGGSGSGIASDVAYDNTALVDVDNVAEALDMIVSKVYYVAPSITSFTASPNGGTYEIGSTITAPITFNWSYNKDITTQSLTDCPLVDETVRTATYNTDISSNKTFTLTANDGQNNVSKNVSYSFTNKVWFGSAAEGTYDDAFILGLATGKLQTNKSGTYTVTVADREYFFIAMPQSYNNSDVLVGNIGGFSTEFGKVSTVSHTNASGYVSNYNIYKSTNSNLGNISFVV